MPVISLQIPVSELLETIRHLLANGKEVREELLKASGIMQEKEDLHWDAKITNF